MNDSMTFADEGIYEAVLALVLLKEQHDAAMLLAESFADGAAPAGSWCDTLSELVAAMERLCQEIRAERPDPGMADRFDTARALEEEPPPIVLARRFGRAHQMLAATLPRLPELDACALSPDEVAEQFARLRFLTSALVTHLHPDVTRKPDSRWSRRAPGE